MYDEDEHDVMEEGHEPGLAFGTDVTGEPVIIIRHYHGPEDIVAWLMGIQNRQFAVAVLDMLSTDLMISKEGMN